MSDPGRVDAFRRLAPTLAEVTSDHRNPPRIVNARAFATAVGASVMAEDVARAMVNASRSFVKMEGLEAEAGALVARATGAEAGLVTNSASGGLVLAAAACLTGTDLGKIEALPDTRGFPRRSIIVQRGHHIKYVNMLRVAGAHIVSFGFLDGPGWTNAEQLRAAIDEETAAVFYVAAFHKVFKGELSLPEILEVTRPLGIPVIVDAAYESDLQRWTAMGADLVSISGGKFVGGPSASGMLCGRADLIEAAKRQQLGIGRALKVGKEEIAALAAALAIYMVRDDKAFDATMAARLAVLEEGLSGLPGVAVTRRSIDHTGNRAWLLELELDEGVVGRSAGAIHLELAAGDPTVLVREYHAHRGILELDVTTLLDGQERTLLVHVAAALEPTSCRPDPATSRAQA